ncbi:hypothetical protein [Methylosinus sp. LW4]|uniref:hypothetical protein n=1 Tax=Methylosinus sp. LW4 TaxID=136993 RepID=UPI00038059D8|nr:hypothetical protein [Methylosinus sp. LW4]
MGEQKRRHEKLLPREREALELTRKLANEGKLLEGGFAAFVSSFEIEIEDQRLSLYRDAYMAGAEHLWSSIMATLDPGSKPTDADLRRAEAIQKEIDIWRDAKIAALGAAMPTKGSA